MQAVIFALNCGADYLLADPLHLAGGVSSYKTALPNDIKTFKQFQVYSHVILRNLVIDCLAIIIE